MSYIKVEHRVLNDPRVLDLSPAAFTVHVYALDWTNEQATDGAIPFKVAHRMMCPLDPVEISDAFKELVEVGLWEATETGYVCPEFLAYGLEADEQHETRAKWSQDKRRRRLHANGNHALCLPARCPAKAAQGTGSTSQVDSVPRKSGRLDPTRPDPTPKGLGSGSGAANTPRSAGATRGAGSGIVTTAEVDEPDNGHCDIWIRPARPEDFNAFMAHARWLQPGQSSAIEELAWRHAAGTTKCDECIWSLDEENALWISVPEGLASAWVNRTQAAFNPPADRSVA